MEVVTVAALAGLIGGAASGVNSYFQNLHSNEQALQRQYRALEKERDENLAYLQTQFDVAKKEANKNADESDRQQTLNEDFLSRDIDNQFNNLITNEEAEGLAFNTQMASNDASTGDALSTMAASGTRNSSMQQAVDMQAAANSAQLQATENATRSQDEYNLANVLESAASGTEQIQEERTAASDLRLSYDDGSLYGNGAGDQYTLFTENYENTKNSYDRQIKELKTQRDYMLRKSNRFLGALSSMFGGASNGLTTGYNTGTALKNSGINFRTTTGTSTVSTSTVKSEV